MKDASSATLLALKKGTGVYNIGGGTRTTVGELAEKIITLVGKGGIKYVKDQTGDVEHTSSDTTKARKELGWKPTKDFDLGLKETVELVLENA